MGGDVAAREGALHGGPTPAALFILFGMVLVPISQLRGTTNSELERTRGIRLFN